MRYHEFSEGRAEYGISAFRRNNATSVSRSSRCIPKASGEVEVRARNTRSETEGQEAFRRPRPCRSASSLESFFRLRRGFLPGEFIPGEALTNHLADGKIKADGIREDLSGIVLPIVEPESLFINVAEQVER